MEKLKKLVAGLTVASTILMSAGPVLGATAEELLAQIQQLQQQLNQLMQQYQQLTGQGAGVPAACQGITFTRDLGVGMSGNDVKCLQALLNQDPATKVAETGAGSPGNETIYFGPLTAAAVKKFQEKYASEILTPLGLTAGTGYVGAKTRAKLNSLLTTVVPPAEEEEEEGGVPVVEEGEMTVTRSLYPRSKTIDAGEEEVPALGIDIKAKGSDIYVKRVKVTWDVSTSSNFSPEYARVEKVVTAIYLYDGSTLLASKTLTKDDRDAGYVNLSGFNLKVTKGTTKTLTLQIDTVPELPTDETYYVAIKVAEKGVRGVDTSGITLYSPETGEINSDHARTITIKPVATGALEVKKNTTLTPKASLVNVGEDGTVFGILGIDVKAKNEGVKVDTVSVQVKNNSDKPSTLELYDGETLLEEIEIAATDTNSYLNYSFDLEDPVTIAKDATKTFTIKFNVEGNINNKLVGVKVVGVSGEGETTEEPAAWTGTILSDEHYLFVAAPSVTLVSAASGEKPNTVETSVLTFKVSAPTTGKIDFTKIKVETTGATSTTKVFVYDEENTLLASTTLTSGAGTLDFSSATSTIYEGETKTYTIKVRYTTGTDTGWFTLKVTALAWDGLNVTDTAATLVAGIKNLITGDIKFVSAQ